mgnify:CR=1 FL=1
MPGTTDLKELLQHLKPELHPGDFVFASLTDTSSLNWEDILGSFKEKESTTVILEREKADALHLKYEFIAAWITLNVHSSLNAVGLTAAFSNTLAKHNISCNVVAGYYHDHIFVDKENADKAMEALLQLTNTKNTTP